MTKKDFKYRQGRSKEQVQANEKLAVAAFGFMLIALTALMFGLLIDRLIG